MHVSSIFINFIINLHAVIIFCCIYSINKIIKKIFFKLFQKSIFLELNPKKKNENYFNNLKW